MEKRKIDFELDVNKLAAWIAVIGGLVTALGASWWIFAARQTHEIVESMPPPPILQSHQPRIEALEKNNEEYQDLWAQQIVDRKQYLEKAVEVCKEAGKCD